LLRLGDASVSNQGVPQGIPRSVGFSLRQDFPDDHWNIALGASGDVFGLDVDNFGMFAFGANDFNGVAFAAFLAHFGLLN
jgi:hypothetical protein